MFERLWLKEELENKYFHIFIFGVVFTIISLLLTNYILPIKNRLNCCLPNFSSSRVPHGCLPKS